VNREPAGIAFIYQAAVERDELVGRRLQEVAETLCEGSLTPLLTQLAQHHDLNRKQQKVLMDLIDDLAKQSPKP
jgi:predicted transcriptional regulator